MSLLSRVHDTSFPFFHQWIVLLFRAPKAVLIICHFKAQIETDETERYCFLNGWFPPPHPPPLPKEITEHSPPVHYLPKYLESAVSTRMQWSLWAHLCSSVPGATHNNASLTVHTVHFLFMRPKLETEGTIQFMKDNIAISERWSVCEGASGPSYQASHSTLYHRWGASSQGQKCGPSERQKAGLKRCIQTSCPGATRLAAGPSSCSSHIFLTCCIETHVPSPTHLPNLHFPSLHHFSTVVLEFSSKDEEKRGKGSLTGVGEEMEQGSLLPRTILKLEPRSTITLPGVVKGKLPNEISPHSHHTGSSLHQI